MKAVAFLSLVVLFTFPPGAPTEGTIPPCVTHQTCEGGK